MKHLALIAALFSTFVASNCFSAQVYKWVDENGQTQFTQFPPPSSQESKSIQVQSAQSASSSGSTERLKNIRQQLSESIVDRDKKKADRLAKKEKDEQNCQLAKQQLREAKIGGRRYRVTESGRHYLDEKEMAESLSKAKEDVKTHCSK